MPEIFDEDNIILVEIKNHPYYEEVASQYIKLC